jgi:hypothetical protein
MRYLSFLLALTISFSLYAQNSYIPQKATEIQLTEDYEKYFPKELSNYINPNSFIKDGINSFRKSMALNNEVVFVYSFFPTASSAYDFFRERNKNLNYQEYLNTLPKLQSIFFKDKQFHEALYQAVMPLYQKEFSKFTKGEAKLVLDSLNTALAYAQNFNLEKEKAILTLKTAYEYGKLKAFIYRRIANNNLTKEECVNWLKRIIKDLNEFAPKASTNPLEEYILSNKLSYYDKNETYIWGKKIGTKEKILFSQKSGKYAPLYPAESTIKIEKLSNINYPQREGIDFICIQHKNGSEELIVFKNEDYVLSHKSIKLGQQVDKILSESPIKGFLQINYKDGSRGFYNEEGIGIQNKKIQDIYYFPTAKKGFFVSGDGSAELFEITNKGFITQQLERKIKTLKKLRLKTDPFGSWDGPSVSEPQIINYLNGEKDLVFEDLSSKSLEKTPLNSTYEYQEISFLNYEFINIRINTSNGTKYGLIDVSGEELLKAEYDDIRLIPNSENNFLIGKKDGDYIKYAFFNNRLEAKSDFKYLPPFGFDFDPEMFEEYYGPLLKPNTHDSRIILCLEGKKGKLLKHGLYDVHGEEEIPTKYEYLSCLNVTEEPDYDYYLVAKKGELNDQGILSPKSALAIFGSDGSAITKFKYDIVEFVSSIPDEDDWGEAVSDDSFDESYFKCSRKGKIEYINLQGKVLEKE